MCSECQRPIEGNALNDHANKIIADIETYANSFYGQGDRFVVSGVRRKINNFVPVTPNEIKDLTRIWLRVVPPNPLVKEVEPSKNERCQEGDHETGL